MWDLIASVPDHCLSFYFENLESLHDTDENKTNITSAKITANKTRIEKLYSDIETFSVDI